LLVAKRRSTCWTWAAAVLALALLGCPQPVTTDPPAVTAPLEIPGDGYATSDACRACHPSQYASWHASYHRTMTQPATPANVFGDFDDVIASADGHEFHLTRRGDEFFARVPDPAWRGDGVPEYQDRRIALVTGRHHLQIYWYETGITRVLGYLPVAWDQMDQRWFPSESNFIKPPVDPSKLSVPLIGSWNYGCISCHVTDERPRWLGPPHAMTEASEFGIACEACHGPSQAHAEQMRSPGERYGQHLATAPPTDVVNPAEFDAAQSSQVCGRCHSVWRHSSNESYQDYLMKGISYQPGDDLAEHGVAIVTAYERDPGSFWPDGEVKPSGREYNGLIASPCYVSGDFGCSSCHAMHTTGDADVLDVWRDDQLKPGMRGNTACLQCHDGLTTPEALTAHSHHRAESSGSECQNCHMPYTNLGLRKAIRSHTISSPNVETDRTTGRLNACNGCHLDRPIGWTADALAQWYGHPRHELTAIERAVPSAVVDLLSGDAAERAVAASALGWAPAVAASGAQEWAPPLLAILLNDPYHAVRFHSKRSLQRIPAFEDIDYDWVAAADLRQQQSNAVSRRWASQRRASGREVGLGFLLTRASAGGADLSPTVFQELARARDDRPIQVRE